MCYPNVAASHGSKYNPTFPLGKNNHHTTIRVESYQSRRRPTSLRFFQNSLTSVFLRSPCREVELFLLLHLKPSVRSSGNLERRWSLSLSLYKTLSFYSSFFSTIFLSSHPTTWSKMGQEIVLSLATCQIIIGS